MTKSRAKTKTKTRAANSLATHDKAVAGRQPHAMEEPPPFGGSWATLYAAVLVNLAALITLFYIFTRAFG
jgi:hypothetical protein